jgi:hypothetical protein
MNAAPLLINTLIVGLIAIALMVLHNPLALFGLMLLRDMPVFPPKYLVDAKNDQDEDDDQPMGFTAKVG